MVRPKYAEVRINTSESEVILRRESVGEVSSGPPSEASRGSKYLLRAAKWFRIRAVSVVIVLVGSAASALLAIGGGASFMMGSGQSVVNIFAKSMMATLPKMMITSIFGMVWYALLALPLANLSKYLGMRAGVVAGVVVAASLAQPVGLALMYSYLQERVYEAVMSFLKTHAKEMVEVLATMRTDPSAFQRFMNLIGELQRSVATAMLPAYLLSLAPLVVLAIATVVVGKVSKVVKASSIKALTILYAVLAALSIITTFSAFLMGGGLTVTILLGAISMGSLAVMIAVAVLEWLTASRLREYVAELERAEAEVRLVESGVGG